MEKKQNFIAQIMTSKSPVRSCEDVDETALSYAEIKALCAGDPRIKEKMDLDIDVARLRILKADHKSQHFKLQDNLLKHYPEQIAAVTERIAGLEKDIAMYDEQAAKVVVIQETLAAAEPENGEAVSASAGFPPITVMGETYTEKVPAAKALMDACKTVKDKNAVHIGTYLGFEMSVSFEPINKAFRMTLKGSLSHTVDLSNDAFGNITRINNTLRSLPERLEKSRNHLESLHVQVKDAQAELNKPFDREAELAKKESRLAVLNADLNIDGMSGEMYADGDSQMELPDMYDDEAETARPGASHGYNQPAERRVGKGKPSILDGIQTFSADVKTMNAAGKDRPAHPIM